MPKISAEPDFVPPPPGSDAISPPQAITHDSPDTSDANNSVHANSLRPAKAHSKASLDSLIGVRSTDADIDRPRAVRDQPRMMFSPGHALVVILLLVAVLGLSFALIVQQSMNLTAVGQEYSSVSDTASGTAADSSNINGTSPDTSQNNSQQSDTESSAQGDSDSADQTSVPDTRVNINTASLEELQSITGVGPVTAQRILDHRAAIGRYTSVDQLLDVPGIGAKTLEKMRGQVRIE